MCESVDPLSLAVLFGLALQVVGVYLVCARYIEAMQLQSIRHASLCISSSQAKEHEYACLDGYGYV